MEATEYVRKFRQGDRAIKLYTQEHQEENALKDFGDNELAKVFERGLRRRIPTSVIGSSVNKHFNKIWENGEGLLRGGCKYKQCRLLFIDKYPGVGQIEYIIQFYENTRTSKIINAVIITSAASKEGEDYLKSLKTPTPKVRLGESEISVVDVVYL